MYVYIICIYIYVYICIYIHSQFVGTKENRKVIDHFLFAMPLPVTIRASSWVLGLVAPHLVS